MVRWKEKNGSVRSAATITSDLSSLGARFDLPQDLETGSSVELLLTLPNYIEATNAQVHCLGRVTRSQVDGSGKVGVAVIIERYHFIRSSGDA
jgi:hypothetical protein